MLGCGDTVFEEVAAGAKIALTGEAEKTRSNASSDRISKYVEVSIELPLLFGRNSDVELTDEEAYHADERTGPPERSNAELCGRSSCKIKVLGSVDRELERSADFKPWLLQGRV